MSPTAADESWGGDGWGRTGQKGVTGSWAVPLPSAQLGEGLCHLQAQKTRGGNGDEGTDGRTELEG